MNGAAVRSTGLPGMRTFRSPRFRLIVALMLAGFGLLLNVLFLLALDTPEVPWLEDFEAYWEAAARMVAGTSPYSAAQLNGPVDAVCPGCYLYPPLLAQVLTPLTAIPIEGAKLVWFALLAIASFASTWLATGIGGARPTLERGAWCVAATTFYLPVFQSNWLGNVSSLVSLSVVLVAMEGIASGIGAGLGILLKVVPGALAPAVFAAGRSPRLSLIATLAVVGGVLFLLAPSAWMDYPTVLRNMLAGSGYVHWNLAPTVMAARAGFDDVVVSVVGMGSVGLGLLALVGSVWLARRPGGMPMAALLGTVTMLIVPGTLWYIYLAVLLPLAAMAWPGGGGRARFVLFTSGAFITLSGVAVLPLLTLVAAAVLLAVSGWVLWPRETPRGVPA